MRSSAGLHDDAWSRRNYPVQRSARRGVLPCHVNLEVRASDGRRVPVAVSFIVRKERDGKVIAHLLQDASRARRATATRPCAGSCSFSRASERAVETADLERAAARPGAEERRAAVDLSVLTRREIDALRFLKDGLSTDAHRGRNSESVL